MRVGKVEKLYLMAVVFLLISLLAINLMQNTPKGFPERTTLTQMVGSNWNFVSQNAGLVSVFQNTSTIPSGEHVPSLTVKGNFSSLGSEIYGIYTFGSPINLAESQEITWWVYADASIGRSTAKAGYYVSAAFSYSYGIYLFDSKGNWKGLDHAPIIWVGWNELVFPTRFEPNDASQGWNDSISLSDIMAIRIDFQPELSVDSLSHSMTFTGFESLDVNNQPSADWTATGLAISLLALVLFSPIILYRILVQNNRTKGSVFLNILKPLSTRAGVSVFLIGVSARMILMSLTPLSSDFSNVAYGFGPAFPFSNLFSYSISAGGPWILVMHLLYRVWLLIPVDHPSILEIYPGHITYPSPLLPVFYFLYTPGSVLFLLMTKGVLLFSDLAIGFLVYAMVLRMQIGNRMALLSFAIWILNPLSILLGVLWGGLDLILAFFLLLSIYYIDTNRLAAAGVAYGLSVGTKLFPAILLPFFILIIQSNPLMKGKTSTIRRSILSFPFMIAAGATLLIILIPPFVLGGPGGLVPDFGSNPDYTFFYGPIFHFGGVQLALSPLCYILMLFILVYGDFIRRLSSTEVVLSGILALFAFSRVNPQFILWLFPLLLISAVARRQLGLLLFAILANLTYDIYYFGFYFMTWGHSFFFYPVTNLALQSWLGSLPYQVASRTLDLDALMGSLFTGVMLGYLYLLFRQATKRTSSSSASEKSAG